MRARLGTCVQRQGPGTTETHKREGNWLRVVLFTGRRATSEDRQSRTVLKRLPEENANERYDNGHGRRQERAPSAVVPSLRATRSGSPVGPSHQSRAFMKSIQSIPMSGGRRAFFLYRNFQLLVAPLPQQVKGRRTHGSSVAVAPPSIVRDLDVVEHDRPGFDRGPGRFDLYWARRLR